MISSTARCWAEVDLDALAQNYSVIRQKSGDAGIMAVVKADAYGHGDTVVAPYFDSLGADWFAVSCLAEAKRLRRIGIWKPILILGYTAPQEVSSLYGLRLTQTVTDLEYALALDAAAEKAGCTAEGHLALDTGMGRIGFPVQADFETALGQMCLCCALKHLHITGAFTHFAVADSEADGDPAYTQEQYEAFRRGVEALQQKGISLQTIHCCNSAALFSDQIPHHDLVRPGIVQYGLQPSADVPCEGLRTAICMKATVAMVKTVPKGQFISYGRTFCAPGERRIATVTAGYADGYPRSASNRGVCGLHGQPAPQVGNVCMDQMMLDVTDIGEVRPGDTVTLFGGGAADSIDELAAKAGTINYTLICGMSRRVPRFYLKNGIEVSHIDYMEY